MNNAQLKTNSRSGGYRLISSNDIQKTSAAFTTSITYGKLHSTNKGAARGLKLQASALGGIDCRRVGGDLVYVLEISKFSEPKG